MPQSKKAQAQEISLDCHICSNCFIRLPSHEDLHVFHSYGDGNAVSEDRFIDHQSSEQVMVFNDTISLRIRYIH